MAEHDRKLAPETSDAGHPQPEEAEVESARLLANEARDALTADGYDADEVRRLADEYVALDLGTTVEGFVAWAREHPDRA
jgi:hypothetical protein